MKVFVTVQPMSVLLPCGTSIWKTRDSTKLCATQLEPVKVQEIVVSYWLRSAAASPSVAVTTRKRE